jgi:16S rRNA (cytidine1402-2'-O)-methyltransferase
VPGRLILCAGPIGNLADAPPRLGEALAGADLIYAEDTRRARVLLDHLGVRSPVRSYFAGNEEQRSGEVAARIAGGDTIALITDAGTPGIADPGLSAVHAALEAGGIITGVPGPSAVTLALVLSGLPADRFVFEGFLPRSGARRSERLGLLAAETRTVVLFCSPNRLAGDLADLAGTLGADRPAAVCRELTKLHEEVWRGTLGEAVERWAKGARGEVTVVLGGAAAVTADLPSAIEEAERLAAAGMSPSEAARRVAAAAGVRRKDVYDAVVRRRAESEDRPGR